MSVELSRFPPHADLAFFVEQHWVWRWDVGGTPYEREVLPDPVVHVLLEKGRSAAIGVTQRRFVRLIEGEGRVVGTRFRVGGFAPFSRRPMHELKNRVVPLRELFGRAADALEREALAEESDAAAVARVTAFLCDLCPAPDRHVATVAGIVDLVAADRAIRTVEELAERSATPLRSLQRLFRRYVGVSPKWVIRRFRIQEAARVAEEGEGVDWARLARDLGYFDQAHFIKDFRAQVGCAPSEHRERALARARACRVPKYQSMSDQRTARR